jgi:biotin transport system ATP-binding protein
MSVVLDAVTVQADGPEGPALLLDDVSCELTAPRTAVIGENGSGKSTLTKAVAGLLRPSRGSIAVDGVPTSQTKRLRRSVGFVFANPGAQAIMPTVREDVALSLRGLGLSRAETAARVERALAEHSLEELADRACQTLSSGQMQRLALCSVLIRGPRLVIADEPTSLLDARHRRIISDLLLAPAAPQVLLVTHDMDLARRCDEAILVQDGRIGAQGAPGAVIAAYEETLA